MKAIKVWKSFENENSWAHEFFDLFLKNEEIEEKGSFYSYVADEKVQEIVSKLISVIKNNMSPKEIWWLIYAMKKINVDNELKKKLKKLERA